MSQPAVQKKAHYGGSIVYVPTLSDLSRCEDSSEERGSIVLMDRKGEALQANPKGRAPQDYSQTMNVVIRSLSCL